MPTYVVDCLDCGRGETTDLTTAALADALKCPKCALPAAQVFTADHFMGARIDAGGEDVATSERVSSGTGSFNLGLPGVETVVGKRADGKNKTTYRPVTHRELGSNSGVAEYAKRHGLTPIEGGRYRTVPR